MFRPGGMGHGSQLSFPSYSRERERAREQLGVQQPQQSCDMHCGSPAALLIIETGISRVAETNCTIISLPQLVLLMSTQVKRCTKQCKSAAIPKQSEMKSKPRETEKLYFDLVQTAMCFPVGMCDDVACAVWLCHYQLAWFTGRCLLG